MRLIDADKFQRDLTSVWKWLVKRDTAGYGTTHGEMLDKVHDILSTQPTAYDVDKIIEQLEEHARKERELELNSNEISENYHIGKARGFIEAIEIVKDGE